MEGGVGEQGRKERTRRRKRERKEGKGKGVNGFFSQFVKTNPLL
jgi:hypothetical protein